MQIIYLLIVGMPKPNFIYEIKEKGLDIVRLSKSNRIWQFGKNKTLENCTLK